MNLNAFLNPTDANRVQRTLRDLAAHDVSQLALTGGLAIELHIHERGAAPLIRPLHDLDFIVASFDDIPKSFANGLLLRHVHPQDPPGKTLLQAVNPESEVRIDVFRAYGAELERTAPVNIAGLTLRIVSLHDLVARHARLNWDLVQGQSIAPKFARNFLRMADLVSPSEFQEIQTIWLEHRKPQSPQAFEEALLRIREEIAKRPDLLVQPTYSTDPNEICERCMNVKEFPLADPTRILSILSYC